MKKMRKRCYISAAGAKKENCKAQLAARYNLYFLDDVQSCESDDLIIVPMAGGGLTEKQADDISLCEERGLSYQTIFEELLEQEKDPLHLERKHLQDEDKLDYGLEI